MATMFSSGDGYEEMMGRHSKKLAPLFADFAQVQDKGKLLDVGCGTGSLTQVLADRTKDAKIVGIDPSKPFVDHASGRFSNNQRISIDHGSATALPYPGGSFDQSLSLLVLMFIADVDKAISEMKRVTKPDGTVAACVWEKEGMKMGAIFWEVAIKVDPAAKASAEKMAVLYSAGMLSDQWRRNGLTNIVETPIDIQMEYKSFNEYWKPQLAGVGPTGAYMNELSPEHKERLRLALMERHLEGRPDGPYILPARAFAVRGTVPS